MSNNSVIRYFGGAYSETEHFEIFQDFGSQSSVLNGSDLNVAQGWLKSRKGRFTGTNLSSGTYPDLDGSQPWYPRLDAGYYCGPGNIVSFLPNASSDTYLVWDNSDIDGDRFRHMFDRLGVNNSGNLQIFDGVSPTANFNLFSIRPDNTYTDGNFVFFVPKGWTIFNNFSGFQTSISILSSGYHAFYKSLGFGASSPSYDVPTPYAMACLVDQQIYRGSVSFTPLKQGGYPAHLPFLVDIQYNRLIFSPFPNTVDDSFSKNILFSGMFSAWDTFTDRSYPVSTHFFGYQFSLLNSGVYVSTPLLTSIFS